MKTARGVGNVELREVEVPTPLSDEVLVEVEAAGVCGSDMHIKHDSIFYSPPIILGHEYVGKVVETGDAITNFHEGDRVVSPPRAHCGHCYQCMTGHVNRCIAAGQRILGFTANGAFAKYVTVPGYILHRVPPSVAVEEATLAEPTACVVHAIVDNTLVRPGDVVVVLGPGPIGLLAIQISKVMGAGKVIVTGVSSDSTRLGIATATGADLTINVETESDPAGLVKEHTDGVGADVVIDASGAAAASSQALEFVKVAGNVALIGIIGRPTEINLDLIVEKELKMSGTWGSIPSAWVTTLRLMDQNMIDVKPLITHRIGLGDWEQGFELLEAQQAVKVVFTGLD
ncbi:MAG: zinc-binding dehydrogenase [Candidatus Thorarchaeota archaeon]